jgi:hypothetical protein
LEPRALLAYLEKSRKIGYWRASQRKIFEFLI